MMAYAWSQTDASIANQLLNGSKIGPANTEGNSVLAPVVSEVIASRRLSYFFPACRRQRSRISALKIRAEHDTAEHIPAVMSVCAVMPYDHGLSRLLSDHLYALVSRQ